MVVSPDKVSSFLLQRKARNRKSSSRRGFMNVFTRFAFGSLPCRFSPFCGGSAMPGARLSKGRAIINTRITNEKQAFLQIVPYFFALFTGAGPYLFGPCVPGQQRTARLTNPKIAFNQGAALTAATFSAATKIAKLALSK